MVKTTGLASITMMVCFLLIVVVSTMVHALRGGGAGSSRTYSTESLTNTLSDMLSRNSHTTSDHIKVCSFNIQVLGQKKMMKANVASTLVKILRQYDIVFVQEVRDSSDTAFHTLAKLVNAADESKQYDYVLSERLGRTNSKEQYGVLYNRDLVKFVKSVQYQDVNKWFERPPYAFVFELYSKDSKLQNLQFALLGCHIKPDDAVKEINHLKDVYDSYSAEAWAPRTIILGDLNAGCGYVRPTALAALSMRTDSRFEWLISDNTDTTVAVSSCPYDRFIVLKSMASSKLSSGGLYEISNVKVFRFNEVYGMTLAQALETSDHYPIELTISTKSQIGKTQQKSLADLVAADLQNARRF